MLRYEGQWAQVDRFYTSNVYLYVNIILRSYVFFQYIDEIKLNINNSNDLDIISKKKKENKNSEDGIAIKPS